ncbi:hypothetical protein IHN63_00120 [Deinococcus sp. 6YEL10]|uniref:hypothetical protein n=1 Tax=Deinococcus sp. 6YEL10 TaxID=2745870 RepID=UPI001E3D79A7|nr:hypothetical protein [Deinococcus sp. 6YEL10]MCD0159703.1 hypothetical protein [Deinococcus sp. 6YEL10]
MPPHTAKPRRQTLDDFIQSCGSTRSAARRIGCAPSTLSTLARGKSHASPELASKLSQHQISLKGLTAHCPNCRAIRNGPHCPRCRVVCIPRNGVPPFFPTDPEGSCGFFEQLIENMRRNGDDPRSIEAVIQSARNRGYHLPAGHQA